MVISIKTLYHMIQHYQEVLRRNTASKKKITAVLLHGDAAFSGQGIVSELVELCDLPGYVKRGWRRGNNRLKYEHSTLIHDTFTLTHEVFTMKGRNIHTDTDIFRRYNTGGTIHIVVNNRIGFTTEPWMQRST